MDLERTADTLAQMWSSARDDDEGCQLAVLQGRYLGVECTVAGRWQSYMYLREEDEAKGNGDGIGRTGAGLKRKVVLGVYNEAAQAARAYDHVVVALFG